MQWSFVIKKSECVSLMHRSSYLLKLHYKLKWRLQVKNFIKSLKAMFEIKHISLSFFFFLVLYVYGVQLRKKNKIYNHEVL